jgi:hypothetical protein
LGMRAYIELLCMCSTRYMYACMTNAHVRGEVGKRKLKSAIKSGRD